MKKKLLSVLLALSMGVFMLSGCGGTASSGQNAENNASAPPENAQAQDTAKDASQDAQKDGQTGGGYKAGFVTFGLGGDFFQQLADSFVQVMTDAGWEASYADGQFDPNAQINACENYIADGVDVLVCWSVAPEAMGAITSACAEKGIKFVSFVQETEQYDALMIADNAEMAAYMAKFAAQWIDKTFADKEDHSVPVAVFSMRLSTSNVEQADELVKIENFSKKAKFVKEVELEGEDVDTGLKAAENLYTTNPEIKVFLTAHNGLGMGINNFYTGLSSPVTDYSEMGVFAINGDNAMAEVILSSSDGKSPLRGMVLTGSAMESAKELLMVCQGIMDGTLQQGHVQKANIIFVSAETAKEYLDNGTVTSVTKEDFD